MSESKKILRPFHKRLHSAGRIRVWSIVISIFGELVQPRKQSISVQELLALTGHVDIEENALRTALSRLAKEGWVEREKQGRLAFYSLSETGKKTFLAASERIYNHSFESPSSDWNLAFFKEPISTVKDPVPVGFTLSRQWQLINREDINKLDSSDVVLFPTKAVDVPDWALDKLVPEALNRQYSELLADLSHLNADPGVIKQLSPLSALVLRYLLIHAWRRLVLRHPLVPQGLLPASWPGAMCHQALCELYPKIVAQSEGWWETPTPEKGTNMLKSRFKAN